MISYDALYKQLVDVRLESWQAQLAGKIDECITQSGHGDLPKWFNALQQLPDITPSEIKLDQDCVTIGRSSDCNDAQRQQLEANLRLLWPWRKGPFNVFGLEIDTEWRSDLKWQRVSPHIAPLTGRIVLDVGCGSGYHCWRMAAQGARMVIGIDPTLLYVMQYHAMQRYIQSQNVFVLPFNTDNMPDTREAFDTIFSMGVLYHRRSPIDHLAQMWEWLQWEGELVLETLVIEGELGQILTPEQRYAKMRNVWFIPSCDTLALWLRRCNFENIRCVDVNQTTTQEQRATDWMNFESLADYLDPADSNKTIEGYPAPRRAIFVANKPPRPHKNST